MRRRIPWIIRVDISTADRIILHVLGVRARNFEIAQEAACQPAGRRPGASTIRNAAPDARETISYKIPAFTLNGVVVYFAAFKKHIGLYPPVSGDARLEKAISTYAGEKGNLRFPLDQPIPYGLIERIVKLRVKQNLSKAASSA